MLLLTTSFLGNPLPRSHRHGGFKKKKKFPSTSYSFLFQIKVVAHMVFYSLSSNIVKWPFSRISDLQPEERKGHELNHLTMWIFMSLVFPSLRKLQAPCESSGWISERSRKHTMTTTNQPTTEKTHRKRHPKWLEAVDDGKYRSAFEVCSASKNSLALDCTWRLAVVRWSLVTSWWLNQQIWKEMRKSNWMMKPQAVQNKTCFEANT